MTSRNLAKKIAVIASDHKAVDIKIIDLRKLTSFTDFFVICTGFSDRQIVAVADAIREEIKLEGRMPIGEEGKRGGQWALIDYGDVVAHIFVEDARQHYQLDKFWSDAPSISIKGVTGLAK